MAIECPQCHTANPDDSVYCGQCATPLETAEDLSLARTRTLETPKEELTTGSTFAGRYQIIEELGKGGMGRVYRAVDRKLDEEIAIKLIKPEIASSKKTVDRFSNELKIARKIVHKNVGRVYELMEEKGIHFITMEYVAGENLKSMIRMTKQLSVGTAVDIAMQICEGLSEAHRIGVVHRDLKPNNIMIDKEGNARIMDFGIARSLKAEGITGAGAMIGTPEYISPEQADGKDVDYRSDIYAVGVILFEMLTRRLPFEGESILSIAVKHKIEKPTDPIEFNAQIPKDLSSLVLRCLEKEREKRYQTVSELLADLRRIDEALPTTEHVVPKKKPTTAREIVVSSAMKKISRPVLIVLGLAVVAVILWRLFPQKQAPIPPSDKPSLAVMYFKNNTGDAELNHWRSAITDLLITDLSQSKFIRVLSGEMIYDILSQLNQLDAAAYSSEILREVAERGGASRVIVGNYTKAGETFRIDVALQDPQTGDFIGSDRVEGVGEGSFYSMVDELTRRIKQRFELTDQEIASDLDREVKTITTASPEAYKLYSEARRLHLAADYPKSIEVMQKALEIDPEFAMAHRSIAMSYSNMNQIQKKIEALTKAFQLRDRVSERESYIIQGGYYSSWEKTYDKAISAYRELLNLYPDDSIGNTNVGILFFHLEDYDRAIEHYTKNIQNYPEAMFAYWNLAETYEPMGLYDKAIETLDDYLRFGTERSGIYQKQASAYMHQGQYDLALGKLEEALSLNPGFQLSYDKFRGDISLLRGDLAQAEQQYRALPEGSPIQRMAFVSLYLLQGRFEDAKKQLQMEPPWEEPLAYLYLRKGEPEEALKGLDNVLEIARKEDIITWQIMTQVGRGLAYLWMGSIDKAQKIADEIRESVQKIFRKKHLRYYDYLMGMIAFEKKDYSSAVKSLQRAVDSLYFPEDNFPKIQPLFLHSLAEARFKAGDLSEAQENYERVLSLHSGRLGDGDFYARSIFGLGQVYEAKGEKSSAIQNYQRFLELWKDADPGQKEVEEAKTKLAELSGASD